MVQQRSSVRQSSIQFARRRVLGSGPCLHRAGPGREARPYPSPLPGEGTIYLTHWDGPQRVNEPRSGSRFDRVGNTAVEM